MSAPPIDDLDLQHLLRLEVGTFRDQQRSRVRFDPSLHVGTPGAAQAFLPFPAASLDDADRVVRAELFAALLESATGTPGFAWVRRPGGPDPDQHDVRWLVGATEAFATYGRELAGFYVITRHGWLDVRSGEARVWKRLRIRR